jgi:hypothetical protein
MTTAVVEDTTAGRTTTSGTYIGVGGMAATITVPPSGAVRIHLRCTSRAVSSSYNALTCIQVSGSVSGTVYTANDLAATIVNGSTNISLVQDRVVTGLSAGETLTVTPMHRINSTGGTMTVDYRYLTVTPALA